MRSDCFDALDLSRRDGDGGPADVVAEKFLDQEPADGVADEDGFGVQCGGELGEVVADLV